MDEDCAGLQAVLYDDACRHASRGPRGAQDAAAVLPEAAHVDEVLVVYCGWRGGLSVSRFFYTPGFF